MEDRDTLLVLALISAGAGRNQASAFERMIEDKRFCGITLSMLEDAICRAMEHRLMITSAALVRASSRIRELEVIISELKSQGQLFIAP